LGYCLCRYNVIGNVDFASGKMKSPNELERYAGSRKKENKRYVLNLAAGVLAKLLRYALKMFVIIYSFVV
jgi:hypothetical protein